MFTVVITVGTEDKVMFLTQVELDSYLRCQRNIEALKSS